MSCACTARWNFVVRSHLRARCMQVSTRGVLVVALASTVANIFESFLGAVVQGKVQWLSNDLVNMTQISVAAGLALVGQSFL